MALLLLLIVFGGACMKGLANQNKWSDRNYSLFCMFGLLLIVAATFRPSFMPDYKQYITEITTNTFSRLEPSFYIIRGFWQLIGLNPLGTLFTYALLGTSIMLICIKRDSKYFWFSLVLFVSVYFILGEMIQMRQAVAMSCFLYSIKYIIEKNLSKYILISIVAIMFHYSAIVMIFLYFLSPNIYNKFRYLGALALSLILGLYIDFGRIVDLMNNQLISDIYYAKTALEDKAEPLPPIYFNIRFLIQILICIFFWIKIDTIQKFNPKALTYLKIYTIGLCVYMIFYKIGDLADRLSTMFLIAEIILIPLVILVVKPNWLSKGIITIIGFKYFYSSITSYLLHG